ncbi:hypothetical protein [Iamia sp.]|uniref:hypothetical protein n=1 Tax=Iamia sp. TaxID=2722710 RepID=UPI002D08494D|nr:hypothetical protein [Iamia sp.]HXH55958.1 hypothetical protein [Iamia sp.]
MAIPVVVMVVEGDVIFAPDPVAAKARAAPGPVPRALAELPPVIGFHEVTRLIASGDDLADRDRLVGLTIGGRNRCRRSRQGGSRRPWARVRPRRAHREVDAVLTGSPHPWVPPPHTVDLRRKASHA